MKVLIPKELWLLLKTKEGKNKFYKFITNKAKQKEIFEVNNKKFIIERIMWPL